MVCMDRSEHMISSLRKGLSEIPALGIPNASCRHRFFTLFQIFLVRCGVGRASGAKFLLLASSHAK